jgi:hypothetical protein
MQTEPLAFAPIAVYRSRGVVKTIPSCASTQRHASEPWQATLFLLRSEVDGFLPFRSISPTADVMAYVRFAPIAEIRFISLGCWRLAGHLRQWRFAWGLLH